MLRKTRLIALGCLALCTLAGCPDDETKTPSTDMSVTKDMTPDSVGDMRSDMKVDQSKDMLVVDMVEDVSKDIKTTEDMPGDMSDMTDMAKGDDMPDMVGDMSADLSNDMGTSGQGGETCAMALDVTSGGTWANQSTFNAQDDYDTGFGSQGCPVGRVTGKDVVYLIKPDRDTRYKVTVTPVGGYDPMLYIKQDCAADVCVDGTVLNGSGQPESLTFNALATQSYFVIVDGQLVSNGDFSLLVEKVQN